MSSTSRSHQVVVGLLRVGFPSGRLTARPSHRQTTREAIRFPGSQVIYPHLATGIVEARREIDDLW
jgi:hypothetical protein